jgi:putative transposase
LQGRRVVEAPTLAAAQEVTTMPRATAPPITLTVAQRAVLDQLVRAGTTPQQVARRARLVLAAADGTSTGAIARTWDITWRTAQRWRARWHIAQEALLVAETEGGPGDDRALQTVILGLLADDPRPGAPPTFTPEQLCQIMAVACEPPGDSGRPISQWTPRELADEAVQRQIVARISARTIGRFVVLGSGRTQAPPEPVLAHAPRARSGGAGGADRDGLHGLRRGAGDRRAGRARREHG